MSDSSAFTAKLKSLVEADQTFDIDIDYQMVRELFLEFNTQFEEVKKTVAGFEAKEGSYLSMTDLRPVQEATANLKTQIEDQGSDFSNELREIRAFFSFQTKDLRQKIDTTMAQMVAELSKPVTPSESPREKEHVIVQNSDPTLRNDLKMLQERFNALVESLNNSIPLESEPEEEEEEENQEEPEQETVQEQQNTPEAQPIQEEKDNSQQTPNRPNLSELKIPKIPAPTNGQAETPKSKRDQISSRYMKALEIRINDLKLQLKQVGDVANEADKKAAATEPELEQLRRDLELFAGEAQKLRGDFLVIKADVERMNEVKNDSMVDLLNEFNQTKPKQEEGVGGITKEELNKAIKDVRVALVQQNAKTENALQEEIRKLRAEVAGLRAVTNELSRPPTQVASPSPELVENPKVAKEEEDSNHNEEEEPPKKVREVTVVEEQEEPAEPIIRVVKIPAKEYASVEIQTEYTMTVDHVNLEAQTVILPNQLITSVLFDKKAVKKPPTDSKIEDKNDQKPTIILPERPSIINTRKEEVPNKDEPKPTPKANLSVKPTASFHVIQTLTDAESEIRDELKKQASTIERLSADLAQTKGAPKQIQLDSEDRFVDKDMFDKVWNSVSKNCENISGLRDDISKMREDLNSNVRETFNLRADHHNARKDAGEIKADVDALKLATNELKINMAKQGSRPGAQKSVNVTLTPVRFETLYLQPLPVTVIPAIPPRREKERKQKQKQKKPIKGPSRPGARVPSEKDQKSPQIQIDNLNVPPIDIPLSPSHSPSHSPSQSPTQSLSPELSPNVPPIALPESDATSSPKGSVKSPIRTPSTKGSSPGRKSTTLTPKSPIRSPSIKTPIKSPSIKSPSVKSQHHSTANISESEDYNDLPDSPEHEVYEEEEEQYEVPVNEEDHNESPKHHSQHYKDQEYDDNDEDDDEEEDEENPDLALINDTLANHAEQMRIIRVAVGEMRSRLQLVAQKLDSTTAQQIMQLPSVELLEQQPKDTMLEESALRAIRRRIDKQQKETDAELYRVNKSIMELQKQLTDFQQRVGEDMQRQKTAAPIIKQGNGPLEIKNLIASDSKRVTAPPVPSIPIVTGSPHSPHTILRVTPIKVPEGEEENDDGRITIIQPPLSVPREAPKQHNPPPPAPKTALVSPKAKIPPRSTFDTIPLERDAAARPSTPDENAPQPYFRNVVRQQIGEMSVLNARDPLADEELLELIVDIRTQLQLQIDTNTTRLNKLEERGEELIDKEYISKFFTKMRLTMEEVQRSVETVKATVPDRVTREEMQQMVEELYATLTKEEATSGGATNYRCLLCGRPKSSISGMITDRKVADGLGAPTQATPQRGGTLMYGPDKQLYRGRGNFGKPMLVKKDEKKLPSLEK